MALRAGRGCRTVTNAEVMEYVRSLWKRMEAMESVKHRYPNLGDVSEPDEESFEEGETIEETAEMRVLRSIISSSSRPKVEISTYAGT